jgi:hypothetical protein
VEPKTTSGDTNQTPIPQSDEVENRFQKSRLKRRNGKTPAGKELRRSLESKLTSMRRTRQRHVSQSG